jgi:hypothetical protein
MAKRSPCPLRFHIATEGGWDLGCGMGCLLAAALSAARSGAAFGIRRGFGGASHHPQADGQAHGAAIHWVLFRRDRELKWRGSGQRQPFCRAKLKLKRMFQENRQI